jgi:hypothetical protein
VTRPDRFAAARAFLYREARVVEQRLFAALFEGAPAAGVVDAVLAYRNADGGFGHGLEPDKRCPDSQPLDVAFALDTLAAAGAREPDIALRACDFLESVAEPSGAVPIVLPSVAAYPLAEHWGDGVFPAGFAPAASIAGRCHELGIEHPWLARATEFCFAELEREPSDDAHALREGLTFLEHAPDRERAERLFPRIVEALGTARWFRRDPASEEYGLTPLHFAPRPDAPLRPFIADDELAAHLDRLESDQQPDGGWPLRWTPPSAASTLEWRGIQTLWAIRVRVAYGRSRPAESSRRGR